MPVTILTSLADTAIASGAPTTVHNGSIQEQEMGESTGVVNSLRSLVKFDFSSIPPGSKVVSAILEEYLFQNLAANARDFHVYRALKNWLETQATWNQYATGLAWTTAGCSSVGNDYDSLILATLNLAAAEALGWKSWTLNAAIVEALIAGSIPNYGFLLRNLSEGDDGHRFYGKDYATSQGVPERAPKLTISWSASLGRLPAYIVDGLQGGIILKASVESFANKVWVRHTPTGGSLTRSTANENTISQARFGIKEQPLSGGNASVAIANQIAAVFRSFADSPDQPDIVLRPDVVIRDQLGNVVPPEEIRPNRWMLIENIFPPTGKVYERLTENPLTLFIEEVSYSKNYGLRIVSGRDRFASALVAKLSGRGGGG